jgi:hypothetical protein
MDLDFSGIPIQIKRNKHRLAGSATAWAAGSNDRVNAGTNIYWTPAAGQAGTLPNPLAIGAFSVYAVDNSGGLSAFPVTATVNVVCFLAGTLIATPTGERPIETLKPGDLISTAEGPQPVRFLARSTRSIEQLQALVRRQRKLVHRFASLSVTFNWCRDRIGHFHCLRPLSG